MLSVSACSLCPCAVVPYPSPPRANLATFAPCCQSKPHHNVQYTVWHKMPLIHRPPLTVCCTDAITVPCPAKFRVVSGTIYGAKSAGGYRRQLYIAASGRLAYYAQLEGMPSVRYVGDDLHFSFAFHIDPRNGESNARPFGGDLAKWNGSNKRKLHSCAAITCKLVDATRYRIGKAVYPYHYTSGQLSSAEPSRSDVRTAADASGVQAPGPVSHPNAPCTHAVHTHQRGRYHA